MLSAFIFTALCASICTFVPLSSFYERQQAKDQIKIDNLNKLLDNAVERRMGSFNEHTGVYQNWPEFTSAPQPVDTVDW